VCIKAALSASAIALKIKKYLKALPPELE